MLRTASFKISNPSKRKPLQFIRSGAAFYRVKSTPYFWVRFFKAVIKAGRIWYTSPTTP